MLVHRLRAVGSDPLEFHWLSHAKLKEERERHLKTRLKIANLYRVWRTGRRQGRRLI